LADNLQHYQRNERTSSRTTPKSISAWEHHDGSTSHGDRVANLAWDETQSAWLTSEEIGFQRLSSDSSIYIKRTDDEFIAVLNAVDDQLYFATNQNLKNWFEQATT
jgi:hypothetical protein